MKVFAFVRRHWLVFSSATAGVAGAVVSFLLLGASGADDPYISYFVADKLASTGKLVNYNGDGIEQSSSLAHVLILAALHVVTRLSVPLLAALLGFVSFACTAVVAGVWARRWSTSAGVLAACLVGFAHPLVYWAAGGLETMLVPLFMVLFLHLVHRALEGTRWTRGSYAAMFAAAFFAAAVRPDALLIVVAMVALVGVVVAAQMVMPRVVSRVLPKVDAGGYVRVLVTSALAVGVLEAIRLIAFGALMPQPVRAKSGFEFAFGDGWKYVRASMPPAWLAVPLAVLLVVGVCRIAFKKSLMGWMSVAAAGGWLVLVMGSGGDWMGMGRLLVSVFVLCLVVCAIALDWIVAVVSRAVRESARGVVRRVVLVVAGGGLVATEVVACVLLATNPMYFKSNLRTYTPINHEWKAELIGTGTATPTTIPADIPWYERRNSSHLRDALFWRDLRPWLDEFLRTHPRSEPYTLGSIQAGMVPYEIMLEYPGRFRFIDMDSLSTDDFSKCKELKRTVYGKIIWIWQWRKWAGQCAPPLPDFFFGHGSSTNNTIGNDYSIVVAKDLQLVLRGKATYAALILAVRNDLLWPSNG